MHDDERSLNVLLILRSKQKRTSYIRFIEVPKYKEYSLEIFLKRFILKKKKIWKH